VFAGLGGVVGCVGAVGCAVGKDGAVAVGGEVAGVVAVGCGVGGGVDADVAGGVGVLVPLDGGGVIVPVDGDAVATAPGGVAVAVPLEGPRVGVGLAVWLVGLPVGTTPGVPGVSVRVAVATKLGVPVRILPGGLPRMSAGFGVGMSCVGVAVGVGVNVGVEVNVGVVVTVAVVVGVADVTTQSGAVTVTTFVIVPDVPAGTRPLRINVADAPTTRLIVVWMLPVPLGAPQVLGAFTRHVQSNPASAAGTGSSTVASTISLGPPLATTMV